MHLDDPSVCITQAQIICVYSGKLGQRSPGRRPRRPPHVHFKGRLAGLSGSRCVLSGAGTLVAGWAPAGWMEEGKGAETAAGQSVCGSAGRPDDSFKPGFSCGRLWDRRYFICRKPKNKPIFFCFLVTYGLPSHTEG